MADTPAMDRMLLRLFQLRVREQCEYLLSALDSIDAQPHGDIWGHMQAAVVAAANLSKLLWGQKGTRALERTPLRASIGVAEDSPLRPTTMRNHLEHIDERLDLWWEDSPNHRIADRLTGPRDMISGLRDTEIFRHYDPTTGDLMFWGYTLNLPGVAEEAERIYVRVKVESEKPHWQP